MADVTVGPWQVDPALHAHVAGDTAILDAPLQLSQVVWPWIAGAGLHEPFLVGFSSERHSTTGPPSQLRNALLRFADDRTATIVAQGIYDKTMSYPRVEDITPVVNEPEQSVPIPRHADTHAAMIAYQQGADRIQELNVATAHGPFVLLQVIHCSPAPDCAAQLAARTLDLQIPLLDKFTPTASNEFASLPVDPSGLVARTLPMPASEATSTTGAAYGRTGDLHFEDDPITTGRALDEAKVDRVSINRATVYQAADPGAADKLERVYADGIAAAAGAQAAGAVPGLPQSHCTQVPGAGGIVIHHWCVATAGRYMIKTIARQLDTAQQETAAQYLILTK